MPHKREGCAHAAHTINGGAGMIGHHRMAGLAHAMENVLDGLHTTPATIDALLPTVDALRLLNHEVATGVPQ